jgi:hypothetical protein
MCPRLDKPWTLVNDLNQAIGLAITDLTVVRLSYSAPIMLARHALRKAIHSTQRWSARASPKKSTSASASGRLWQTAGHGQHGPRSLCSNCGRRQCNYCPPP